MEYKVLSGPFNVGKLERDLNGHAAEGWRNGHAAEGWRNGHAAEGGGWSACSRPSAG